MDEQELKEVLSLIEDMDVRVLGVEDSLKHKRELQAVG